MRISVNLASHPYVELGPVYNRLRTWTAILVLLGVALYFLYRQESTQAQEKMAQVHTVRSNVQRLEAQRQSYQALMQQPKDAAILRQSDYLNNVFKEKAFSWTAIMTDLEMVLPTGVQVLSIDPIIAPDGHVAIRLRVTGPRDRALDLIRNLERSKHFADPRLASESAATGTGNVQDASTGNNVNFDVLADYRPLPLPVKAAGEKTPVAKHPKGKRPATSTGAAAPGAQPAGPAAPGPRPLGPKRPGPQKPSAQKPGAQGPGAQGPGGSQQP